MTNYTAGLPPWRCAWRGEDGAALCASAADRAILIADQAHLSCPSHAEAEASDPLVGSLPLLDPMPALPGETYLAATFGTDGVVHQSVVIAWQEEDADAPDGFSPACLLFNPEQPDTAPVQWPSFDAYYEVLCDPSELESDDSAGAATASAEVRGYLRTLHPDPSRTRAFRCQWRGEYDGVYATPDHGWALVVPVTVRAALSSPSITGDDPLWPVSAEGIVDANSWTGAEHGWGIGCGHFLHIVPVGTTPPLQLQTLTG